MSDRHLNRLTAATTLTVALLAAALSYVGLRLAVAPVFPGWPGYLYPLLLDGMILIGSLGRLVAHRVGARAFLPWLLLTTGVAVSVAGNAYPSWITGDVFSVLLHALPPLIFAATFEGALQLRGWLTHTTPAANPAIPTNPAIPVIPANPAATEPQATPATPETPETHDDPFTYTHQPTTTPQPITL